MERWFKHIAVRLWTSLLLGSIATLVVLPPFAAAMGPQWMVVPGIGLLVIAYWLTGLVFATVGRRRLTRLIGEANVWARADMPREARKALDRATATVDSFLFSPFSRKAPVGRLLSQLAHFQMAQTVPDASATDIIGAYLLDFPNDREAAIKWLDSVLAGKALTRQSHDIAARIGSAHADDRSVQLMLAQFFLAERCCDFTALQTYRYLMDDVKPLSDGLLADICDLLLAQRRVDNLALETYLTASARGIGDRRLLPGIAACHRMIPASPLNGRLLERADAALSGIGASRREQMANAFLPGDVVDEEAANDDHRRFQWSVIVGTIRRGGAGLAGIANTLVDTTWYLAGGVRDVMMSRRFKSVLKWTMVGMLAVGLGWLVFNTASHLAVSLKTTKPVPAPAVAPVTDPFTLQVAAYLNEGDARRYTEQLKGLGLDAYWRRASGANKTWYQVRVSHFKTKAAARAFGEDLKKRQIIGDFYVANYKRPDGS